MVLEVENLTKKFDHLVLDHISFQVSQGEFVVILGSSGAGKSTLMRCLNGLMAPTSGKVRVHDIEVCKKNLHKIRQKVGFIFQNFNVIGNLTVMQNVLIGLLGTKSFWNIFFTKEEKKIAEEAIELVGLKDKIYTRVEKLSGGQKQRVAIARVLVQKPDVILADEPVSNLDPVISREILDILRNINESKGTLVICNLHQLEYAVEYGHRIIGIHSGKVVFDGNPQVMREQDLARIYGEKFVQNEIRKPNRSLLKRELVQV